MYLYRVEKENRKGPYDSGPALDFNHNNMAHPTPYEEGLVVPGMPHGTWLCGFETLDHLRTWFTLYERNVLAHGGFRVVKIRIRKELVHAGTRQLVFSGHESLSRKVIRWDYVNQEGVT